MPRSKTEQRQGTLDAMEVFEGEKQLARKQARCMGCDRPTERFAKSGNGRVLCGDVQCFRYYLDLHQRAHRWKRNQLAANRYRRRKGLPELQVEELEK